MSWFAYGAAREHIHRGELADGFQAALRSAGVPAGVDVVDGAIRLSLPDLVATSPLPSLDLDEAEGTLETLLWVVDQWRTARAPGDHLSVDVQVEPDPHRLAGDVLIVRARTGANEGPRPRRIRVTLDVQEALSDSIPAATYDGDTVFLREPWPWGPYRLPPGTTIEVDEAGEWLRAHSERFTLRGMTLTDVQFEVDAFEGTLAAGSLTANDVPLRAGDTVRFELGELVLALLGSERKSGEDPLPEGTRLTRIDRAWTVTRPPREGGVEAWAEGLGVRAAVFAIDGLDPMGELVGRAEVLSDAWIDWATFADDDGTRSVRVYRAADGEIRAVCDRHVRVAILEMARAALPPGHDVALGVWRDGRAALAWGPKSRVAAFREGTKALATGAGPEDCPTCTAQSRTVAAALSRVLEDEIRQSRADFSGTEGEWADTEAALRAGWTSGD